MSWELEMLGQGFRVWGLGFRAFIWGYYGTHYRVRLYPPLGYSILYKGYNLTGFNHHKNPTHSPSKRLTHRI